MNAEVPAQLIPLDGPPLSAELISIGPDGIVFQPADEAVDRRSLEHGQIVRWSHPVDPGPESQVLLADGGTLVAVDDWSGQEAVRLGNDTLKLRSGLFGNIELPRDHIQAVLLNPPHDPVERVRLLDRLREFDGHDDEVHLIGGDRHAGTVRPWNGDELTIDTRSGAVTLPTSQVEAVVFNARLVRRPAEPAKLIAGLDDGSLLYAADVDGDKQRMEVTLIGGRRLVGRSIQDIAAIQSTGGTAFTYLSDLESADYRHVPYLEIDWPLARDRNLLGARLKSGGSLYLKGLSLHSTSRLTYLLDGSASLFQAEIALDDVAGARGSVVFRVFLARDGTWHEAFTSGVVSGGDAPQPVSVDLTGAQVLTLVVDFADRGDELDHANWLDARLINER